MAGEPGWAWEVLDIDVGADARTIKRAYSRLLKLNRPEHDPAAFQLLHQAYQAALAYARFNPEPGAAESTAEPARAARSCRRADELHVAAPLARPDPQGEALDAWRDFLADAQSDPRARLSAVAGGQALLSFAARDAFELLALRHCADAACDDVVRDAIVDHFGWHSDVSHMARLDAQAAEDAVGRYRAAQSYDHFHVNIVGNKAIEFLLADSLPRDRSYIHDAGFAHAMKDLIEAVRWRHPELLAYRIDAGVFDWWEQRVAAKKYFWQTAAWSALGGAVVFVIAWIMLRSTETMQLKWAGTTLFFLCQLATFATVAWMVLQPRHPMYGALGRFKRAQLDGLLHVRRFENDWQFGWIAPFACLALLMLMPDPGPMTRLGLGAGLFLCAAASMFAGSAFLSMGRFFAAAVLAGINAGLMTSTAFSGLGYFPCLFFSIGLFTLALQHGDHLFSAAGLSDLHLTRMRVGWIGAVVALYFANTTFQLPEQAIAIAAFALFLGGVLLARMVVNNYLVWFALVVGVSSLNLAGFAPHMHYLAPALVVTTFFMVANLVCVQPD